MMNIGARVPVTDKSADELKSWEDTSDLTVINIGKNLLRGTDKEGTDLSS